MIDITIVYETGAEKEIARQMCNELEERLVGVEANVWMEEG